MYVIQNIYLTRLFIGNLKRDVNEMCFLQSCYWLNREKKKLSKLFIAGKRVNTKA